MIRVAGLSVTPVKGTQLQAVEVVKLGERGVRENRRFYLIDEQGRMLNGKPVGELNSIVSRYDDQSRTLELEFPDGRVLCGPLQLGPEVSTQFFSRQATARLVLGDWSEAISQHVGRLLRLVEADAAGAVDRGERGAVSLISRASLDRLAQEGGLDWIDVRRFRMLIEIEGVDAHEEDTWIGRAVAIGAARIRPDGNVGRCLITSRDPETGEIDVPTLDLLGQYRREVNTTEPLPFGVYGQVLSAGTIRVGDPVMPCGG